MADTKTFDIYDDKGNKIVNAKPSPIEIDGLTASKTYTGYTASYAGATAKTPLGDIVTKAPAKVAVTSIKLDQTAVNVKVGATFKLVATVAPATATDATYAYTTSDDKVATVDTDGNGKAIAAGTATITATTTDGAKTATATITVVEPTPKVDGVETTDTTATVTLE
ncbi:Ig-like domain-containing protein [Secundilactobacillus yichangensis]|uniref:Ig-like domain-containing protein n=1 Tax=Secundilactobacillus yichangensis TaxID=2799580 RepID=UPI001941C9BB|nr:Ig-like domain-containing protein [Secundilactobacillus yichangensis]